MNCVKSVERHWEIAEGRDGMTRSSFSFMAPVRTGRELLVRGGFAGECRSLCGAHLQASELCCLFSLGDWVPGYRVF